MPGNKLNLINNKQVVSKGGVKVWIPIFPFLKMCAVLDVLSRLEQQKKVMKTFPYYLYPSLSEYVTIM